ncbi:endonuclease/exonuclease/phosphatase family protein [Planctomicrobium piriforme]|uniref:Metal-dependent hydrolase, endonuclease/exonuclease/phosphatase family n=1 Tax=Planctomicrobium piriforme TaxID=1576369 RepID=A0A1I3LA24_9PLAN|nr:endonuclease/exonuclease/phosphatase family protein [Planctomicrobium piriforme]SFI81245.1 Metal-dependent hydrolase, endonuclease/exonuclease/phosphatase family [Planctomicrobium piriforme]
MPRGIAFTLCLILSLAPQVSAADPAPLRVMSFNIRYAAAKDGPNAWDLRKDFLIETIHKFNPDLLGTQETEAGQRGFLVQHFSEYGELGVGRDDGQLQGEMMAVFYRKSRFDLVEGGHFWLSETPDVAGSKSWNSAHPRMVTWVLLKDKLGPDQPELYFFNTHFDHISQEARNHGGLILHDRIAAASERAAVIVTGDFNSKEGSEPYTNLFTPHAGQPLLTDAYRAVHPAVGPEEGTANAFNPANITGARIDWIGFTKQFTAKSAEINRVEREGKLPSDHFPIEVVLNWR